MPQFDFSTFSGQIFWLIITFAIQYLVMIKFIVPGLKGIFNKRYTHVEQQLTLAEAYASEAEKIHLEYEQKISEAKRVSQNAISEASTKIHQETELALAKLQNKLLEQLHQRELRAKRAYKTSIKTMDEMIINVATELASKATHIKINKKDLIKYI